MPHHDESLSQAGRWSRNFLVTLLASAPISTAAPMGASARLPVDLTGDASAMDVISPGLDLAQRNVEPIVEDCILSNCMDTSLGKGPAVLTGTFAGSGEGYGSCPGSAGIDVVDVTWFLSNGATDTRQISVTLVLAAIRPRISGGGTAIFGRFFGDTLKCPAVTWAPVFNPLDCLTDQGLTSISASAPGALTRPS